MHKVLIFLKVFETLYQKDSFPPIPWSNSTSLNKGNLSAVVSVLDVEGWPCLNEN